MYKAREEGLRGGLSGADLDLEEKSRIKKRGK